MTQCYLWFGTKPCSPLSKCKKDFFCLKT
jgi:hypothetical protein